jgi:hypothetical protein
MTEAIKVPGHTPGPWHVDPKSPEESFFEDVNILRHDGLAIAVCVHNGDILPPEPEANARLIAAAPELLAVLQDIVAANGMRPGHVAYLSRSDIAAMAQSAIAKAEGTA